jgi:hypothetical protein
MIRDIISHITEKEKPQAIRLTQKLEEMKAEARAKRTKDLYDTLIYPEVKEKYYDSLDPEIISTIEKARAKAALQREPVYLNSQQAAVNITKDPPPKPESIAKFQNAITRMTGAFTLLKTSYFPDDMYRYIRARRWPNFEEGANTMLTSPYTKTRLFALQYIERMAYQELVSGETTLPETFSAALITNIMKIMSGNDMCEGQHYALLAVSALARLRRFRPYLMETFRQLLALYKSKLIYKANIELMLTLLIDLAIFEDIDHRELSLLDFFLEHMESPLKYAAETMGILQVVAQDILEMYKEYYIDPEERKDTQGSDDSMSISGASQTPSRMLSRRNSMISQMRRMNTRNSTTSGLKKRGTIVDPDPSLRQFQEKEQQRAFAEVANKRRAEKFGFIANYDQINGERIVELAAHGLKRLMLPSQNFSFIGNIGTAKQTIYQDLLDRDLVPWIMNHPSLKSEGVVKRMISDVFCLFVLQTTRDSKHNSDYVIFYLKSLGLLQLVSEWSKDPDLIIRANAAWIFSGLCVNRLVPPLELTNFGLIRDMFVLFIKLYQELPNTDALLKPDLKTAPEQILHIFDYEDFENELERILDRATKTQHLLFATLIFLSIYDDEGLISAAQQRTDKDVNKPVEENALSGLKELLQKNTEKMKLFVEILIQFTICDDIVFQKNGIWYLKHIIINPELIDLLESHNMNILEVFIAGSVCESSVIQQECVNVLTYLAIERKAYQKKEDPLLDALMYLTGVPSSNVRGLAYNGLAALALHGAYASETLLKQANVPDYFETVTKSLKSFRKEFVSTHFNSETVAMYSGVNLLLSLSRSATPAYQFQVCERVPLILDTIAAQNQLYSDENMNEVGCLLTLRALMCSTSSGFTSLSRGATTEVISNPEVSLKEQFVISYIERVSQDNAFRLSSILINNNFVLWALELLETSDSLENCVKTANLLRDVLHKFLHTLVFEHEETPIRSLLTQLLKKFSWTEADGPQKTVNERLVEISLIIFLQPKNIVLAVSKEVLLQVELILDTYDHRSPATKLALSKHLGSTARLPQALEMLLVKRRLPKTLNVVMWLLNSDVYEQQFNAARVLVFLTKSLDFCSIAYPKTLRRLCVCLESFHPHDLHPVLMSIGNLLVYSRRQTTVNEFDWFYTEGYFETLMTRLKHNDCHSLMEASLDLMTKLLVEHRFFERLFEQQDSQSSLVKDLISVLSRAISHECEERCNDLSSQAFSFAVHGYTISLITLKRFTYAVAGSLLRRSQCVKQLEKRMFSEKAVGDLKYACDQLLAHQKRRVMDSSLESMLCEICVFLELCYSFFPPETISVQLLRHMRDLLSVTTLEKVSDQVQNRTGGLILHTALSVPLVPDADHLSSCISPVLYIMSNTDRPSCWQLHRLAVWALRQLYLRCQLQIPEFDYKDVFHYANAVRNVVPKLREQYLQVQENALLCLAVLFEHEPMKLSFLEIELALANVMQLGAAAAKRMSDKAKDEDLKMLIAYTQAVSSLVRGREDLQGDLNKTYGLLSQMLNFINNFCGEGSELQEQLTESCITCIKHCLATPPLHRTALSLSTSSRSFLQVIRSLFHELDSPTYVQLQVDCHIVQIFYQLSSNRDNLLHESPRYSEFASLVKLILKTYSGVEYLSQTEVDTHKTLIKTIRSLVLRRFEVLGSSPSDEDREDFLQELSSQGMLDSVLTFEQSNVPEIRKLASDLLDTLAPPTSDALG